MAGVFVFIILASESNLAGALIQDLNRTEKIKTERNNEYLVMYRRLIREKEAVATWETESAITRLGLKLGFW